LTNCRHLSYCHRGWRAMNQNFFAFAAMDGNLEQIASLVDSGKLESGL